MLGGSCDLAEHTACFPRCGVSRWCKASPGKKQKSPVGPLLLEIVDLKLGSFLNKEAPAFRFFFF